MRRLGCWAAAVCAVVVAAQGASSQASSQAPAGSPPPAVADFVAPGAAEALPPAVGAALAKLGPQSIAAHIAMLSSPAMDGRGLGTHALEAAAEYIASTLAAAGVPPLTPGATVGASVTTPYFHDVPVREVTKPGGRLTIRIQRGAAIDEREFLAGVDVVMPEVELQSFSSPLVYAGYGIRETAPARDDFRGLDVRNRIVVVRAGLPPGAEWQVAPFVDKYAATSGRRRFAAKAALAQSLGARAVLAIEGEPFAAAAARRDGAPAVRYFVGDDAVADDIPVIRVSSRVGRLLLEEGSTAVQSGTERLLPLPGAVSATVAITGDERVVMSRNVLAVIKGADPALANEAVVVGAHFDHLGREGDKYFPGADDNASGTAALLEMAKAIAGGPAPKRTMVFAWWTGEEEGHLGSEHYVRHPAWPLAQTSVYLNLDMIAHPWKREEIQQLARDVKPGTAPAWLATVKPAEFLEVGVPERWPFLWPLLSQAARGAGVALHFDRTDGTSGGSDYRAFARRDVAFVRFFGDYFDGYHEPTDTAAAVDPAQVLRVARLALAAARLAADR